MVPSFWLQPLVVDEVTKRVIMRRWTGLFIIEKE
jgi:hypothetical protein